MKGCDCKLGSDGGEIVTFWGKSICWLSHRGAFSQEGHGSIGSGQTQGPYSGNVVHMGNVVPSP